MQHWQTMLYGNALKSQWTVVSYYPSYPFCLLVLNQRNYQWDIFSDQAFPHWRHLYVGNVHSILGHGSHNLLQIDQIKLCHQVHNRYHNLLMEIIWWQYTRRQKSWEQYCLPNKFHHIGDEEIWRYTKPPRTMVSIFTNSIMELLWKITPE